MPTSTHNGRGPVARRPRGSLSPDQILDEAQRIVERDGLRQLSMPVLAKHLGSGVTSIYWYFRSKDELLRALTDRVFHEMYKGLPIGDKPWDEEMFDYFLAFRDLIEDTPVYREVFTYRVKLLFGPSALAPAVFKRVEEGLAVLVRAGLTPTQAAGAYTACTNYTRGFVILERGLAGEDDPLDALAGGASGFDPREFPILSQLGDMDLLVALDDAHFRLGLRLVLEGIGTEYGLATSFASAAEARPSLPAI